MISFGEVFPVEVQLRILGELIHSRYFPRSLVRFSQADKQSLILSRDNHLWSAAIRLYFPFIDDATVSKEINITQEMQINRWRVFKLLYERCINLLKSEALSFEDYTKALLNEWSDIPQEKHRVLIGLVVAAGHARVFDNECLAQAKNDTLLFSAALGNRTTAIQLMNHPLPPSPDCKRRAFILASQYGLLTICTYLLTHAPAEINREILKDAFLNACTLGHLQVVQVLLASHRAQSLTLYLPKALYLACMQGHAGIATELLRNVSLNRNSNALKDAIQCAVRFSELRAFEVLLQEPYVANNQLLMIDLFKLSVDRQNSQMMSMILKHAKTTFPLVCIVDAIDIALNKADDETVLLLLKSNLKILPYARRNIFNNATKLGRRAVIEHFLKNDAQILNAQNMSQAIRLAASNNHADLLLELIHYCGNNLTTTDKRYIRAMPCYQTSSVLKRHTALAEPIVISEIIELTEITQRLERVKLDHEIVEQPSSLCLMQYSAIKGSLKSIDSSRQKSFEEKKRASLTSSQ